MKVLRYSAVAAVAIFAAACGDKVTVAGPTAVTLTSTTTTTTTTTPVAPGKINSIAVAPAAVTLTIGQAVTLVAAVNADPGVATTVTWSTSDATKVTVVAGLVTAVAATPGVAICATSTVNVGVKGCASAVVVAASATVPATASIQGVYGATTATPINPASVAGSMPVLVNVDPGTETLTKIYLKIGTVVADSQVFSAAQSAAIRNAAETANETGAQAAGVDMGNALQSIMLTANTAKYNDETGAVSFANGSATLSVELYVAGTTTARSTARYSTNLTLANADTVIGTMTLPSTATTLSDYQGYAWTRFGSNTATATLRAIVVAYSGKAVSAVTLTMPNVGSNDNVFCQTASATATGACTLFPTGADTATVKAGTVAGNVATAAFGLFNLESASGVLATGSIPTALVTFTDGTGMTLKTLSNAAVRADNKGPARASFAIRAPAYLDANSAAIASTTIYQGKAIAALAPSTTPVTLADSAAIISWGSTGDGGISRAATQAAPYGLTFKAYRNVGGVSATAADTLQNGTQTEITGLSLTAGGLTSEAGKYCVNVVAVDALGNTALAYNDAQILTAAVGAAVGKACVASVANGKGFLGVDNTLPVLAFSSGGYSAADTTNTAASPTGVQYYWTLTETNKSSSTVGSNYTVTGYNNTTGAMVRTCGLARTTSTTACTSSTSTVVGTTYSLTSGATAGYTGHPGKIVVQINATDLAGNVATTLTRVNTHDAVAPSAPTALGVSTITVAAAVPLATYLSDDQSVARAAAVVTSPRLTAGGVTGMLPVEFAAVETAANTATFASFLNVSFTQTVAANYAPIYLGLAGDLNTNYAATTQAEFNTAAQPKYGFYVADQAGNINSSAAQVAMSYVGKVTWTASEYVGVANGLIPWAATGTGATNVITAPTLSVSSTALIGPNITSAGTAAGSSMVITASFQQYRYMNRSGAMFQSTSYVAAIGATAAYCNEAQTSAAYPASVYIGTDLTATGWSSTLYTLTANPAPAAVYVMVQTTNGTLVPVATMTAINTVNGTANSCAATTTRTYQYTYTPAAQRTTFGLSAVSGAGRIAIYYALAGGHAVLSPLTAWTYLP